MFMTATRKRDDYDAVVVGARCAGAATAMLLARRGLRVLAIDRAAEGSDTISTHALMRGGVMLLDRWGLLGRVRAAGSAPIHSASFHYGDGVERVEIRPQGTVDALYAPRRPVLDGILATAAREAGAETRFGTTLLGLLEDDHGRVRGVRIIGREGRQSEVTAGIVVGADGVRSTVAEEAGAVTLAGGKHAASVVFGYFRGMPNDGYHWHYRPGLTAGCIPTTGGQSCVFTGMPPHGFDRKAGAETIFQAALAKAAPDLAAAVREAEPVGALRIFGGIRGHLRQASGAGWALVGDAGYFKDPATAHGITDAFRDAELLARAVARGGDAALEDYQHLRDALSLPLFQVTDAIASFDWSLETLKPRLAALNEAMKTEVTVLSRIVAGDRPAAAAPTGDARVIAGAA